jgi:hypothetical protein
MSDLWNKKSLSSVKIQFATHEECVKTLVCLCAVVTGPNRALTAAVEEYLRSNGLKSFVEEIHQQQQEHQRSSNNTSSDPAVHQLNRISRPSSSSFSSFSPAPANTATPLSLLRIKRQQQQQAVNRHFHHHGEENSSLNNNMSDGGNNSDNHSENSNYQDNYQHTYNESNDNSFDAQATAGQQLEEEQGEEGHSGKESNISYDSLNISEDSGRSLLMEDLQEK